MIFCSLEIYSAFAHIVFHVPHVYNSKASHTRYRAFGPELIQVYSRWL